MKNQQSILDKAPMREIKIEKVTLNIGAGKSIERLEKSIKLIKQLTGIQPMKTITQKRIAAWSIRPGLPVGCKLTLRGKKAREIFAKMIEAKERTFNIKNFDQQGNLSFGIPEYIDIPDTRYDPDIGVMGLQVCVTLSRPGFRIKNRRIKNKKIPLRHKINQREGIDYYKKKFDIKIKEEAE